MIMESQSPDYFACALKVTNFLANWLVASYTVVIHSIGWREGREELQKWSSKI